MNRHAIEERIGEMDAAEVSNWFATAGLPTPTQVSPLLTTGERALRYRPPVRMCLCLRPESCSGESRASDGSHCRDHLTPRLADDAR